MLRPPTDAKTYFEVALEHVESAQLLYAEKRYPLSMYVSGLSVECLFRAFIGLRTLEFDQKHDLKRLFKAAKLGELISLHETEEMRVLFDQIFLRWSNADRYLSDAAARRRLKNAELDRGIRGDYLKENCRIIVRATLGLINKGRLKWNG